MTIQDKASYGIDQEDKRSLDILKKVVFSQAGLSRSDFLLGSLGTGGIISQKLKRQIDFADDSDRAPEEIASSNMRTKHSRRDFLFQTRIGLHRLGEPDRYDRSGDLLKDTFRNFFNLRSTFNGPQIEVQHFQEPEKTWARIWFGTGLTWDIVDPRFLFHILFSCCSIFVWCFFSGSHRGRTHRDSLCSQGFLGLRTNGTMQYSEPRFQQVHGFSICVISLFQQALPSDCQDCSSLCISAHDQLMGPFWVLSFRHRNTSHQESTRKLTQDYMQKAVDLHLTSPQYGQCSCGTGV